MENKVFVINQNDIEKESLKHGLRIEHQRINFTQEFTTNKLVASAYIVPPGKVSWPYHYHAANEEMFYILEGKGELRTPQGKIQVKRGDFMRFPVGEQGAHQLKNTSETEELKYIDFGTAIHPDITMMIDSGKIGVFAGSAPGQNQKERYVNHFFKMDERKPYLLDE